MEKIKKIICLLPFLIYMSLFFLYGLYYVLMTSIGYNRIMEKSFFTMDYYKEVLSSSDFYKSLWYTMKINGISALLSLILTIIILYFIYLGKRRGYSFGKKFEKIIEIPVFIPYLVGAYGILLLLMRRGVINMILYKLKIIKNLNSFPILTNDLNGIGIITTYIWKTLPFMVMMTLPVLFRINKKWNSLGKIYSLSDFLFFKNIVFPLILPSLSSSFFIVLTYLFASFETPYILGVTYPKVLSVEIFDIYTRSSIDSRGKLMVMNIFVSLISLFLGGISYLLLKYLSKFREREW